MVLEKFVEYAHEQGYIPYRAPLSELFAPVGISPSTQLPIGVMK